MSVLKRIRRNINLGLPSPQKPADAEVQYSRVSFPHMAVRLRGESEEDHRKRRNLDKAIRRADRKR